MSVVSFIGQIAPAAVTDCVNTGVFPSVLIAQAIKEGASGTSKLARMFNNLFGHIASSSWSGKVGQTVKGGKLWRWYNSWSDSIEAHVQVLRGGRYRIAGVLAAKTPFEQAIALQKAGYNAGPDKNAYAASLAQIIKQYNLQQYDNQMMAIERQRNPDGLAYSEKSATTREIHNAIG